MELETARLLIRHVYRVGLREEWLQEDNDSEGVCMRIVDADGNHETLLYPAESLHSAWSSDLLQATEATIAVVSQRGSVAILLSHHQHERSISLETGETIPILADVYEAKQLAPHAGCFLLRKDNVAVAYGSGMDVIKTARQLDAALVSALVLAVLPASSMPISQDRMTKSSSQSPSVQFTSSGSSSQELQQSNISRISSFKVSSPKINKFVPDAQQSLWLETLPKSKSDDEVKDGEEDSDGKSSDYQEESLELKTDASPVITRDAETGECVLEEGRSAIYISSLLSGLALAVNMVIMSLFVRDIVLDTLADWNYTRLALLSATIPRFFVAQFFCEHVVLIIAQLVFPVSQMHRNSLYYSSQRSKPLPKEHRLPHFTIQMPCYREGLHSVLAPSLRSVYEAVRHYQSKGGTANIIVSEDGLRLLEKSDAEERIKFYNSVGCSWVARPANGVHGYERRGRFKKASNLNFTYTLSLRVEEVMAKLTLEQVSPQTTADTYNKALQIVLEERNGDAWVTGDIRIGDYILLIDSDTRVPLDCLMDAASEMERSPDVAALQHCSGITYVQHHYFERLLGYFVGVFTNFSISWVCANGASAPLMGHNCFLRWTALQECQKKVDNQGERAIFSSKHVSEDYELALRLQMSGYCTRWATYSNQEFKEGVSLNPNDEKARWQKYAFGACEIVFNPFYKWYKGPFSGLFWRYIWSSRVHTSAKAAAISYLSSYFAIAVSLPITIGMTAAQGLFWPTLDTAFKPVFDTWIAVIFVFNFAGALGLILCRSRCGHQSFLRSSWEGLQHLPAIIAFFSGIAYHLSCSVLAYFFSVKMTWGATSKDYQQTSLAQVLRSFWHCYLVMFILLAISSLSISPIIPLTWRIEGFTILFPLFLSIAFHILFPIILDPGILHKFMPRYYASASLDEEKSQAFFHAARGNGAGKESSSSYTESKVVGSSPSLLAARRGTDREHSSGLVTPHSQSTPYTPSSSYDAEQTWHSRMPKSGSGGSYFHSTPGWRHCAPIEPTAVAL
ncbi:hypothetical protein CBS101457_005003 [Exobasidium rhododendri]|nr:hypothetical protein CBS101457_005003 [Exobasidium rhododendri]